MDGWVGYFSSGPHTPVTFLDKYTIPQVEIKQTAKPPLKKLKTKKTHHFA